jgi:hypothetical protein
MKRFGGSLAGMTMRYGSVAVLLAGLLGGSLALAQENSSAAPTTEVPYLPPTDYKPKFAGDPARSEAEALALGYMRTVVEAQRQFRKKKTKYAPSLVALVGSGSFTKRMLRTDRGEYTATFIGNSKGLKYGLQLIPKQFNPNQRSFFVNESGIIRADDDEPATQESPVLKPDRQQTAGD